MKASAGKDTTGFWYDIFKNPKTDPSKASKKGRLALVKTSNGIETVPEVDAPKSINLLEDVFVNGKILRYQTLAEIRTLSNQ
jgi:nicotinamide phosphoribosyltransferase